MRKERRAKLTIEEIQHVGIPEKDCWIRLKAKNGEVLMHGETVANPTRARAAVIRAMVDVLEAEGYRVEKEEPNER